MPGIQRSAYRNSARQARCIQATSVTCPIRKKDERLCAVAEEFHAFAYCTFSSAKAGNCNEKQFRLATHFDSFPDNTRTASGCLFCDKFTVGSSHKVTTVTQLSVMSALGQQWTLDSTTTY